MMPYINGRFLTYLLGYTTLPTAGWQVSPLLDFFVAVELARLYCSILSTIRCMS